MSNYRRKEFIKFDKEEEQKVKQEKQEKQQQRKEELVLEKKQRTNWEKGSETKNKTYYGGLIQKFAENAIDRDVLKAIDSSSISFSERMALMNAVNYLKAFPGRIDDFELSQKVNENLIEQSFNSIADSLIKTAQIGADISMQSVLAGASYKNFGSKLQQNILKHNNLLSKQASMWQQQARQLVYFTDHTYWYGGDFDKDQKRSIGNLLYDRLTKQSAEEYIKEKQNFSQLHKMEQQIFEESGMDEDIIKKLIKIKNRG